VFDDAVAVGIALDLGAAALDEGAVVFKGLDQLQDAAHVVARGFAELFELFIDHHGADAVVHIDFQQQRAVYRKGQDVAALHTGLAGLDAMLQVKRGVGGALAIGQGGQQFFGGGQRQLGVDGVVFAFGLVVVDAYARDLAQEDQLVGLHGDGHRGGDFFHRQVEGFAGRGKTERREQHHGAEVQHPADGGGVDLAHQARVLEVHAVQDADRPRREEVAGNHPHRGARHRGVGQALAEGGLNLVAQLAGGFLRAV
jgi:hypothetical protein